MPISQTRMLVVLYAAKRILDRFKAMHSIAQHEIALNPNDLTARMVIEAATIGGDILEDAVTISMELKHFDAGTIKRNQQAADRSRRHRMRKPDVGIRHNPLSGETIIEEHALTPEMKKYWDSIGVNYKVRKPDEYDAIAAGFVAPAAAPPHPQAHKFHDTLHDVPQHEGELFAGPSDNTEAEQ